MHSTIFMISIFQISQERETLPSTTNGSVTLTARKRIPRNITQPQKHFKTKFKAYECDCANRVDRGKKMVRAKEAPAGCIIYLMLSIVINLFILILRISAHDVQNNATVARIEATTTTLIAPTIYHTDVTATSASTAAITTTTVDDIKTMSDDIHRSGKQNYLKRFLRLRLSCLMFVRSVDVSIVHVNNSP